jgi:multiple antibiotic resistance protein
MIWDDFARVASTVLVIIGALLPVVNPPGDAPLFLAMTRGYDGSLRAMLARRIGLYSFALLLGAMQLGGFVLRIFGLSLPVVQVAGGAIVCALSWRLLGDSPRPPAVTPEPDRAHQVAFGRAFYPLTMPLSIDAGAISVAITVGANHRHTIESQIIQLVAAIIGCGFIAVSLFLTYRHAERISQRIGPTGMTIVLHLSAFILLCIGVSIGWNGIRALLSEIAVRR